MEAVEALIAVLEKEIELGEELLANLAAQAEAFFSWNVSALIRQLEKKETLLRRLSRTEEERREVLGRFSRDGQPLGLPLSRMTSGICPESRQACLDQVRKRALAIYRRLQTEETILLGLMGDMLEYFKEALRALVRPGVCLYGQKGDITTPSSGKGLIHGRV
jgi:flagellar biosynthesis/type III secretory pathway chaperone